MASSNAGVDAGEATAPTRRLFEVTDCRETAARFRLPVARQVWVRRADGSRANSSDGAARGTPPYILIMDLVFSAVFSRSAQMTRLGATGVIAFFLVFLPVSWLWTLANNRFNCFDPEDLSFELFNLLLMAGAMLVALNAEECLCAVASRSFTDRERSLPAYTAFAAECDDGAANSCLFVVVGYSCTRLLITALSVYIGTFVPLASALKYREGLTILIVLPLYVVLITQMIVKSTAAGVYNHWVPPILWGVSTLIEMGVELGCHSLLRFAPKSLAQPLVKRLVLKVPMNIAYAEARYERMVVIALGFVVGVSVVESNIDGFSYFSAHGLEVCFGVPWLAFALKVFYFDLSPHHRSGHCTHAMRTSVPRAMAWTLLHGPLIGTVLWISQATDALLNLEQLADPSFSGKKALTVRDSATTSYAGAVTIFLAVCTVQQTLHKGAGHGHRKLGRTKRLLLRICSIAALALHPLILGAHADYSLVFWSVILVITLTAAIELWGRGFSRRPGDAKLRDDGPMPPQLLYTGSMETAYSDVISDDLSEGAAASPDGTPKPGVSPSPPDKVSPTGRGLPSEGCELSDFKAPKPLTAAETRPAGVSLPADMRQPPSPAPKPASPLANGVKRFTRWRRASASEATARASPNSEGSTPAAAAAAGRRTVVELLIGPRATDVEGADPRRLSMLVPELGGGLG